jgi:MarR family transcriptional regulator, protease production regulatory protein HPr
VRNENRKQLVIMVRALYFCLEERWAEATREYPVSPAQQHILYILATAGEPLTVTAISRIGCWHISTVTRLLRPLLAGGLVTMRHHKHNAKSKYVSITDTGEQLRRDLTGRLIETDDFPFDLSDIPEEELQAFLRIGLRILQDQKGEDFVEWIRESELNYDEKSV